MNELVKIINSSIGGSVCQAVNARDLHAYLGIGKDFSSWVKAQIIRARLVEFRDYVTSPSRVSSGQPTTAYHLTLDAGKQVAMMSETDKGFEVRDYFLECERRALSPVAATPTTFVEALRLALVQAETIAEQTAQLEAAKPAVEFVEKYADATGLKGFRQVCKMAGAKENQFRDFLEAEKIMYRLGGEWAPTARQIDAGRMVVKAGVSGSEHAFNSAMFTPKGVLWVIGEWAKYKLGGAAA